VSKRLGIIILLASLAALVRGALPSLAVAKTDVLMYKGAEMMVKANKVMQDAVGTIQKGQEMYVQICSDKGCVVEVGKGNQMIDAALKKAGQGMNLMDEGQVQYNQGKGRNRAAAVAGGGKMIAGGRMVQDSLNAIEQGVKMNNDVLRAKNLAAQVEAPTNTILKGTESGLTGMKQFLEGQNLSWKTGRIRQEFVRGSPAHDTMPRIKHHETRSPVGPWPWHVWPCCSCWSRVAHPAISPAPTRSPGA